MKNTLHIKAAFDQPALLKVIIEQLVSRKTEPPPVDATVHTAWETISLSSAETYATGTVAIADADKENVNSSFITRFLFTCSKSGNKGYEWNWSMSMN